MLLGSLSHHNNDLEQRTLKPSVRHSSQVLNKSCHSSQTNQCYSSTLFRKQQENPSSKKRREWKSAPACACACKGGVQGQREREKEHTHVGERARESLAPPFTCFLPPGPALCKLGSARSAVLPEVLTLVLRPFFDLPLFYFHGLFSSLSFSHHHFGLLFPILTT